MAFKTINAPHVNVNDLELQLTRWFVQPWQKVSKGQAICSLETTKSAIEIEASDDGYLYPVVALRAFLKVGEPLAHIFPTDDPSQLKQLASQASSDSSVVVSKKAAALMAEHGLTVSDFPKFTSISSDTVIAKIRELREIAPKSHDQKSSSESLDQIEIKENAVLFWGDFNQALVAVDSLRAGSKFEPVAYVSTPGDLQKVAGLPNVGKQDIQALRKKGLRYVYVYAADRRTQEAFVRECEEIGLELISVVHPSAAVSPLAIMGRGIFVGPLGLVGPEVELGDFVRVLNGASVAHHSKIGTYSSITDGAHLGGNVIIGANVLIGIGANLNKRIMVGDNSIVVSGATVTEHVPANHILRHDGQLVPLQKS